MGHLTRRLNKMRLIDAVLNRIQLYSYLLPTVKIGNAIMDFREKYTLPDCKKRRGGIDEE